MKRKRTEVPVHFGPPKMREEMRLFGRWVLWVKYGWFSRDDDQDHTKLTEDRIAAALEHQAAAISGQPIPSKVEVPNAELKP